MRTWVVALALSTMLAGAGENLRAAPTGDGNDQQWLMMVRTLNTDPVRESEFNDWYDHVDIPDVLDVPGYWRARRGQVLPVVTPTQVVRAADVAHYVALYNIRSPAIDKTIIDMLMATWKMLQRGRDTALLKVEERAYYRQYSAPYSAPQSHADEPKRFLFLERFDIPKNGDAKRINGWYDQLYRRVAEEVPGVVGISRYELYRVLMFEPKYAPRFLTLYEIAATSAENARHVVDVVLDIDRAKRVQVGYEAGDALLYVELGDWQTNGPH